MNPPALRSLRRLVLVAAAVLPLALLGGPRVAADPPDAAAPAPMTAEQMDELVAAVALYPDVVLDSMLPATTAPSDVAAAAGFVAAQGGTVRAAPQDVEWDPSVLALLQFPDVLRWMGENPAWVERMGYAVITQQADVLAAIQRYRARARAAGVLTSDEHQTVTVNPGPTVIVIIEPAVPSIVYVPVYDPWLLYGSYAYSPSNPFFSAWFGFSFGISGLWSRHRIYWGTGIYDYGSPWWWGRWRTRAADWGTGRPTRWYAPERLDPRWTSSGGYAPAAGGLRPIAPRYATSGTATRRVGVAPTPRVYEPATLPPTAPTGVRTSPRAAWPHTATPAAPVTRWNGQPAVATPRVLPTTAVPRVLPRSPTVVPRFVAPTPRVVVPNPPVIQGGTLNGWSSRGRGSLEGRAKVVVPTPALRPTPRVVAPAVKAPARVMPSPRPQATPVPNGLRTRTFTERGKKVLLNP